MYSRICCNLKNTNLRPYISKLGAVRTAVQLPTRFCASDSSLPEERKEYEHEIYKKYPDLYHIYRFPHINYASFLANLKIYVIPIVTITSMFLDVFGEEPMNDAQNRAMIYSLLLCTSHAYLVSIPFFNFVGHIHVTPEKEVVLSYLNGWGNRKDEKFAAGDLVLVSREKGFFRFITKDSFYVFIRSRSTGRKFRINFKHADVYDVDELVLVLGEIPENAVQ